MNLLPKAILKKRSQFLSIVREFLKSQENMVITGLIAMTLLSIVLFVFIRLSKIQSAIPNQFLDAEI